MKIGEKRGYPVHGVMMRARNGALYYKDPHGTVWVKDPNWRTDACWGSTPSDVMASLAPFTVIAIVPDDANSPEDLARIEASAIAQGL